MPSSRRLMSSTTMSTAKLKQSELNRAELALVALATATSLCRVGLMSAALTTSGRSVSALTSRTQLVMWLLLLAPLNHNWTLKGPGKLSSGREREREKNRLTHLNATLLPQSNLQQTQDACLKQFDLWAQHKELSLRARQTGRGQNTCPFHKQQQLK